jgi:DNA repair protein RadC
MRANKKIYKKNLKTLPSNLLPREKALNYGIETLSAVELLSLILGKGTKELNVLGLSKLILKNGKVEDLKEITLEKLKSIKGIGDVKALQILAIKEIIRRIEEGEEEKIVINSSQDVFNLTKDLSKASQEKLVLILTNTENEILFKDVIAIGSINLVNIKPRDIFFYALKFNAFGLILVHNHPNGNSNPSKEDIEFTNKINKLSKELGFQLLDHIIIGRKSYFSFFDNDLIM